MVITKDNWTRKIKLEQLLLIRALLKVARPNAAQWENLTPEEHLQAIAIFNQLAKNIFSESLSLDISGLLDLENEVNV